MNLIRLIKNTAVALALILTCTSLMAEWTSFGRFKENTPNAGMHYIDFNSLQKTDDKATLWQLISFKTSQLEHGLRYTSIKTLFEFDCTAKLFRVIEAAAYSKAMGEGSIVDKNSGQKAEWNAIPPNSTSDFLWQSACKKSITQPITNTDITLNPNGNKKINLATEENGFAIFSQMKSILMNKYDPLSNDARINEERLLDEILNIISPKKFMEDNAANKAKNLISEYKSLTLKIHELNISFASEMKTMTEESLTPYFTRRSLNELNKYNDELIPLFNELTETRHEKSNIFLNIVKLIETNKDTTKISNGSFIFKDQSTIQRFNQYINDLEHVENKESSTMQMLLQNRQEFIDKLLSDTSGSIIEPMPQKIINEDKIKPEVLPEQKVRERFDNVLPDLKITEHKTGYNPIKVTKPFDWSSLTVPKLNNFVPRKIILHETDPEGSLFMANLAEYTIWGTLMAHGNHRDPALVDTDVFNVAEHLTPDQIHDLVYYALDTSVDQMQETRAQLANERKNKAIIAAHPYKSFLISLILNSPFLTLAISILLLFIREFRKNTPQ